MEDPLRVRVVFDDRKMLTKSQRSEGLKHCWILLRPDIATISDLALHVHRSFNLQRSCPNGLLLSMDCFVLPPFESTCVLKDKDTIRVRKKVATQMNLIELGDDPCSMQCSGSLKKQHIVSGGDFLAIREFGECSDCKMKYHEDFCAHTENVVSTGTPPKSKKKRKHSDGIQSPKRKKLRTSSQKPNITGDVVDYAAEADEDTNLGKSLESSKKRCSSQKRSKKKQKPSTADGSIVSQLEDKVEQLTSSDQKRKRNVQTEDNVQVNTCETHAQSRNARRKKDRRQWLKELKLTDVQNSEKQISANVTCGESTEQQEGERIIELEKDIVPVAIRPGHIRFLPLDEEQSQWQPQKRMETRQWNGTTSMKKGQNWSREKMGGNWNGANGYKGQPAWKDKTMSKGNEDNGYGGQKWAREKTVGKWNDDNGYRGQKWAREKNMSKWNDDNGHRGQKWASKRTGSKWNGPNGYEREKCTWDNTTIKWNNGYTEHANRKEKFVSKWSNANRCTEQCNVQTSNWSDANGEQSNKKALSEKGMNNSCLINFESLFPLTRIPQVGDVLAYRLIEMSSSWCPEVSSFRVGLVTSYNYISLGIILVPVPEHPIHSQENFSPYKEDGSLQIHYPSLVDVRLLKASDSEATTSDYSGREVNTQQAAHANNWELAVAKSKLDNSGREMSSQERVNNLDLLAVNSNAKDSVVQPTDSGNANGSTWDQIKQVLNDKRAQLQNKKDGWDEWTPNKSTPNTSWSYDGLRRNAAGSIFTYQRGKNNNNNKRPFRK